MTEADHTAVCSLIFLKHSLLWKLKLLWLHLRSDTAALRSCFKNHLQVTNILNTENKLRTSFEIKSFLPTLWPVYWSTLGTAITTDINYYFYQFFFWMTVYNESWSPNWEKKKTTIYPYQRSYFLIIHLDKYWQAPFNKNCLLLKMLQITTYSHTTFLSGYWNKLVKVFKSSSAHYLDTSWSTD